MRIIIALSAILIVASGVVAATADPAPSPTSAVRPDNGRIADLVAQLTVAGDRDREAAAKALAKIGRPAVPALLEVVNGKDKDWARRAAEVLEAIGDEAWVEAGKDNAGLEVGIGILPRWEPKTYRVGDFVEFMIYVRNPTDSDKVAHFHPATALSVKVTSGAIRLVDPLVAKPGHDEKLPVMTLPVPAHGIVSVRQDSFRLGAEGEKAGDHVAVVSPGRYRVTFSGPGTGVAKTGEVEIEVLPAPAVKTISELIAQLADTDFAKRAAAQDALVKIGKPAAQALTAAAKDPDPERSARAKRALEQIAVGRWGEVVKGVQIGLSETAKPFSLTMTIRNTGDGSWTLSGAPCGAEPMEYILIVDGRRYRSCESRANRPDQIELKPADAVRQVPIDLKYEDANEWETEIGVGEKPGVQTAEDQWEKINGEHEPMNLEPGRHVVKMCCRLRLEGAMYIPYTAGELEVFSNAVEINLPPSNPKEP
jgi:hypothetical protein